MFERGFKSWCENVAVQIRKELALDDVSPLPPASLAEYLGARIWTPQQIQGLSPQALRTLTGTERDNWSAITVTHGGIDAVVFNPTHSIGRRSTDIMHELSHILTGHKPATVVLSADGALALRSFDPKQEDEANWLSGCLLLPRPALVMIERSGLEERAACQQYGVSDDLLRYRLNVTGVTVQMKRRRVGK